MTRDDFGMKFTHCFCLPCQEPGTDVHEIARGSFRGKSIEEPAAWIKTCRHHHDREFNGMPIATQLALKLLSDPENYDREAINRLRRRAPNAVSERDVAVEVSRIVRRLRSWD